MAKTLTVWVRLKDPTPEADRLSSSTPGALPLILRMRSSNANIEEDFVFPYSPREINIGSLSDEMVQIERPGTTPIVAFKSHKLMTIDFTALIAHPGDGLIQGVDSQIFALRRFASSSDKVFELVNYDVFTRTPFVFRNMSQERLSGLFFSITDMSIDVTRRNKENSITSANVKISLVENRNPNINIALIPPLFYKKERNKRGSSTKKVVGNTINKVSDTSLTVGGTIILSQKGKKPMLCPDPSGAKKPNGEPKLISIKPGKPNYCG
jgi:hypothetical protein